MPTSATGTSSSAARCAAAAPLRARGFTLIELLVVVVIIGVVAATVVLSVNTAGRDGQLEQERDRIVALMGYVRERAELQTREYGLHCRPDGYEFVVFDPVAGLWKRDELDSSLRHRALPVGLRFALDVEGRKVVLDKPRDTGTLASRTEDLAPQIMLYSNGDISSFRLRLQRLDPERWVDIRNEADGSVKAGALETGTA